MAEDRQLGRPSDWEELERAGVTFYRTYEDAVHSPVQFIIRGKDAPGDFSLYHHPQRAEGTYPGSFAKYVQLTPYERVVRYVDDPEHPGLQKGVRAGIRKRPEAHLRHIVAHEIGHHVLGHGGEEDRDKEALLDMFGDEGLYSLKELGAEMWALGKRGRLGKYRKDQLRFNVPYWREDLEPIYEEYVDYLAEKFNVKPSIVKWFKSIRPASEEREDE